MASLSSSRAALLALHLLFYVSFASLRNWFVPLPIAETMLFGLLLIWISVVDVERLEIPDTAVLLLVFTGVAFAWPMPLHHIIAGVFWPALFWGVGIGYARLRGWDGLGFGDVKLMAGIGLWLGFTDTTLVVFAAAMAGIFAIVAAKLKRGRSFTNIGTTAVAFAPFLCLSAWVIWLF